MLKRILLLMACVMLLFVSWAAVLGVESQAQKQAGLIALAESEINNGTYINAVAYLTEAVTYKTKQTFHALEMLKDVYHALGNTRRYIKVLEELIAYNDCPPLLYDECARYYTAQNKQKNALEIIKLGIERTQDESLKALYEEQRYVYTFKRDAYDEVTAFHNGGIQIRIDDLWGLANSSGKTVIPCMYPQISTYDTAAKGSVVAMQPDQTIATLNMDNQPIAKMHLDVLSIGNLSQNIIPVQLANGKWIIADSKLISNNHEYDGIGTVQNSAVALKKDGKWGVTALGDEPVVPFEYDEIIMDELGRCYAQNAVFAKANDQIHLLVNGELLPDSYEDARPFTDDGWAAVKKNGLWGFIDITGAFMLEPQFEDAQSFSGHLAAVRQGELWGYISLSGKTVIEPVFIQAKNFANGTAPVLTEQGWQFISLLEFS